MILLHCKHCLRFGMDYYRHLFALKFSTKQLLGSLTTQSPLGIQRRDELMSCRICGFSHGFNICLRTMWTRRAQLVLLAISSGSFAISSTLGTSERELYLDLILIPWITISIFSNINLLFRNYLSTHFLCCVYSLLLFPFKGWEQAKQSDLI